MSEYTPPLPSTSYTVCTKYPHTWTRIHELPRNGSEVPRLVRVMLNENECEDCGTSLELDHISRGYVCCNECWWPAPRSNHVSR